MAPQKSIPNDIYQFSTFTALEQGFIEGQPRICNLPSHGTHGIGALEGTRELVTFVDGKAHVSNAKGGVRDASEEEKLCFAMVTVFQPEGEFTGSDLRAPEGLTLKDVERILYGSGPILGIGGKNTLLPIFIEADFSSIRLVFPGEAISKEFGRVHGTVFGFRVPRWMEGICGPEMHCHFVGTDSVTLRKIGGRVDDFHVHGEALVKLSKCGRFHLGFPQAEEWEELNLGSR